MLFILSSLVAVVAFVVWSSLRTKAMRSIAHTRDVELERNIQRTAVIGTATLAGIALLIAISQCITQIPAGHVGVIDFFGRVSDRTLKSGVNLVNPMARVIKMSVQTKEMREQMHVLSKEGLSIALEISALYRLDADSAANVYKTIAGGNFEEIILVPQFRSISRAATASFQASALYSLEREQLAIQIQQELAKVVGPRGVTIEATPLRGVGLPPQLTEAIEQKQKADQESQRIDASSHQTSISNRPNVAASDVPMATTIARLMVEDLTRQGKERNEKPTRKKPALCLRIIQAWLRFG